MKNKKYIIIAVLLLVIGVVSFIYFEHLSSPEYSIKQISKSLKNHDIVKFKKFVDIKNLTNELLDKYISENLNNNSATTYAGQIGEKVGSGLVQLMRSRLEEQYRREIQKFVEEGSFNSSEVNEKNALSFPLIVNKIMNFKSVKSVVKEGKIANVNIEFESSRYDTVLNLNVQMRDKGFYWQLFNISNYLELIKSIIRLETNRTTKLNEVVLNKFGDIVKVSEIKKRRKLDKYLKLYVNEYYIEFKNISNKEIILALIDFDILNSFGRKAAAYKDITGYTKNLSATNISPGGIYEFILDDLTFSRVAKYDLKKYKVRINDITLSFKNDTGLYYHDDWDDLFTKD